MTTLPPASSRSIDVVEAARQRTHSPSCSPSNAQSARSCTNRIRWIRNLSPPHAAARLKCVVVFDMSRQAIVRVSCGPQASAMRARSASRPRLLQECTATWITAVRNCMIFREELAYDAVGRLCGWRAWPASLGSVGTPEQAGLHQEDALSACVWLKSSCRRTGNGLALPDFSRSCDPSAEAPPCMHDHRCPPAHNGPVGVSSYVTAA
jgi:hypothetical protein